MPKYENEEEEIGEEDSEFEYGGELDEDPE